MKKICIYGKGGIGKSTVTANTAAAAARAGSRVLVVGCDPKADTTRVLMHRTIGTMLDAHMKSGGTPDREDVLHQGAFGVMCMEAGGPRAGEGCAGKGISLALDDIRELEIIEETSPDLLLFDVLGDVVCGGFSTPLRAKAADIAYIVTSSDYMSIYAANNIAGCIKKFALRGGCRLGGLIFNERSALADSVPVERFAKAIGTRIIGTIPMDPEISRAELHRMTVIERAYAEGRQGAVPPSVRVFEDLARFMAENDQGCIPEPLPVEELEAIGEEIARRAFGDEEF